MNGACNSTFLFVTAAMGPGEGPKGQISITKSILKIFKPNFVPHMNGACNSTFFFCPTPWGPGEGPKGQILIWLSPPKPLDEIQPIWCVWGVKWAKRSNIVKYPIFNFKGF